MGELKPKSIGYQEIIARSTAERQKRIAADKKYLAGIVESLTTGGRVTGVRSKPVPNGNQVYLRSAEPCLDTAISNRYISVELFPNLSDPESTIACVNQICQLKPDLYGIPGSGVDEEQITVLLDQSVIKHAALTEKLMEWLPEPVNQEPAA
jgi:hypothetical protein